MNRNQEAAEEACRKLKEFVELCGGVEHISGCSICTMHTHEMTVHSAIYGVVRPNYFVSTVPLATAYLAACEALGESPMESELPPDHKDGHSTFGEPK